MAREATGRNSERVGVGKSSAVLLILMLLSVTSSVMAAEWADGLAILAWAAMGGLAVGIAFARMRLRSDYAHLLMLIFGMAAVGLLATFLLPDGLTLEEKGLALEERLITWAIKVASGDFGGDNLVFVVQLGFLSWVMGYGAAWSVYRNHQIWGAILPAGAALLFNLYYSPSQSDLYLEVFVLSSLLLLARMNLHRMECWWKSGSVRYGKEIRFDWMKYGGLLSVLLMTTAWLLPTTPPGSVWFPAFEPLQGPWQDLQAQFNRAFPSLHVGVQPTSSAFFGATLTMGGPVHLGQQPVMDIQAYMGRYWRAIVYDKYTGIGWINTHLSAASMRAGDPRLDASTDLMRVHITQTVTVLTPGQNLLFAQAQPVLFTIPVQIRYGQPNTPEDLAVPDLALAISQRSLRDRDIFTVVSLVSIADEESLRTAPTTYSSWITANYLALPSDLPERVRILALQITADDSNPYDKAMAIEQYLRKHILYNDAVSAPPPGRDGVDFTLFDRPEGYCNYYASAMAVLARAVGIPARVASGYSMGDSENGIYHIIEANAHSWTEIYFPNFGWINFEPTVSKPEIKRPQRVVASDPLQDPNDSVTPSRRRPSDKGLENQALGSSIGSWLLFQPTFFSEPGRIVLLGAVLVVLFAFVRLYSARRRNGRGPAMLTPTARVYGSLLKLARWLRVPIRTHATPFEHARLIGDALPRARGEIESTTFLYVREQFGRRSLDESEGLLISEAWDRIRTEWRRGLALRFLLRISKRPRAIIGRIHRVFERKAKT